LIIVKPEAVFRSHRAGIPTLLAMDFPQADVRWQKRMFREVRDVALPMVSENAISCAWNLLGALPLGGLI
jgi:hypothetical protein